MEFNDYQIYLSRFDKSPGTRWYYALGLGGETGEVLEKVKKYYRDNKGDVDAIRAELGDVLWYLARLADSYGIDLQSVATGNIDKLTKRTETGTIHGEGDNRERVSGLTTNE